MQTLELLYQKEFKGIIAHPRKVSLDGDAITLCGPRGSGKSYLIYDFLSSQKFGSYLYIDFEDLRVGDISREDIEVFIDENSIKILVFDNFDFRFTPLKVEKTIITTYQEVKINGYESKKIYPLDFEEFLAFDGRFISEKISFNNFSTIGTYPFVATASKDSYEKSFQLLLYSWFPDALEFALMQTLSLKQGSTITLLGLFKEMSLDYKISKDKFYTLIKDLQAKKVIFLVERYEKKSHSKKIYMIDFAIRGILSFEKDFIKRLENIIFLELLKRGEEIYYTDRVDFVVPKKELGVISMAFTPEILLKNRIYSLVPLLKQLGLKKLQIVTLELEFSYQIEDIEIEVLPFWSFALGN